MLWGRRWELRQRFQTPHPPRASLTVLAPTPSLGRQMHMEHETGQAAAGGPEQRHRCAHPGCHRRWDQWHSVSHLRRLAQSHYCGSCQRSFCKEHTCISSHGAVGSCGLESTCYCHACFGRMPPEVKAALKATNKCGFRPLPLP